MTVRALFRDIKPNWGATKFIETLQSWTALYCSHVKAISMFGPRPIENAPMTVTRMYAYELFRQQDWSFSETFSESHKAVKYFWAR
jgi:hypothetical protein